MGGNLIYLAISYAIISRASPSGDGLFGYNDISWVLKLAENCFGFYHNNTETPLSGPVSSRVGVYLDHRAGILSFYSVSEKMTLLYKLHTRFTRPLYVGVWIGTKGEYVEFIKPK